MWNDSLPCCGSLPHSLSHISTLLSWNYPGSRALGSCFDINKSCNKKWSRASHDTAIATSLRAPQAAIGMISWDTAQVAHLKSVPNSQPDDFCRALSEKPCPYSLGIPRKFLLQGGDPRVGITLLGPAEAVAGESRIFGSALVSWNALQQAEGGYSKHSEFIKASTCKQSISI